MRYINLRLTYLLTINIAHSFTLSAAASSSAAMVCRFGDRPVYMKRSNSSITSAVRSAISTRLCSVRHFNHPILNSHSLKTVSSIDDYLNSDDCILYYSLCLVYFVNVVHIVR